MLAEDEKEAKSESFNLCDVSGIEDFQDIENMDEGGLRLICHQLININKASKLKIKTLMSETLGLKRKVNQLEIETENTRSQVEEMKSRINKQDKILNVLIKNMDESKKSIESSVKKSEEYVGKMELNKKEIESSIKKSEEIVGKKYNEVVKLSKDLTEDKNEITKMSTKVEEAVGNVKGLVKGEIKNNANLIREECERASSIIVTGISEPVIENIVKRQDYVQTAVYTVLDNIKEDDDRWKEDVLEIRRVGRYDPDKKGNNKRPVKVRFNSERTAREVLAMANKLRWIDGMKGIYINKDMSLTERKNLQELREEARNLNENRTDEEAKKYFFAVRWGKVKKLVKRIVSREEEEDTVEREGATGEM